MSIENIQVSATQTQAPINIQIGERKPETLYSKRWMRENITKDDEFGDFIKSLFVQYDVVKGLFIPNKTDVKRDNKKTIETIKERFINFFDFKYNVVNKENTAIGVSVIKKLKPSTKMNVKIIDSSPEYLGAKCLLSSKKNSSSSSRKWKIQLICKFKNSQRTRDLLGKKMKSSNILKNDYTLLLSEEICDDNNGPCSITKEPSNEILQYYNIIIKNSQTLLKDEKKIGTYLPNIIEDIKLVVEMVPSVADIVVKLLSSSTFNECDETELSRLLSGINMPDLKPDTPDNKAKIIILLSLYENNVDPDTIQEISGLFTPINRDEIMPTIKNYVQQITLKIKDEKIKELVKKIPTRIQEYQTNSSCQSKINEGLTEFNKSVSNNTTAVNNFLSTNIQNAQNALGGATETLKDATPDVVKKSITQIVENIIPQTNTNDDDDHDNFVKSILALLNTSGSDEDEEENKKKEQGVDDLVIDENNANIKKEENGENKTEEPFGENKKEENKTEEPFEENKKDGKKEEPIEEPFGENKKDGKKEEPIQEPFGELIIGKKEEPIQEPFGELIIGKKEEPIQEPFGELVIGENKTEEPFGELVKGKNNDLTKSDFVNIPPKCEQGFNALINEYSQAKKILFEYNNKYKEKETKHIKMLKKMIESVVTRLYGIHRFSLDGNLRDLCDAFPTWNEAHKEWFKREKNEIQPIIDEYNLYLKEHSEENDTLDINAFKFNGGKKNILLEIGENDIEYGTI
jgi:hypothetical protein